MSFSSLPCLIALARTCICTLNRSSGSRHLYLVPDPREKMFNSVPIEYNASFFFFFSFFNIWPLLCGDMFLLIPSLLRVFIMKVLYFVKFFYIYWEDHEIFIFSVIIWFMYLLEYFEPFLYLRDNSYFFIAFNPFKVFTSYSFTCWKFFAPIFRKGWYSQFTHITLEGW